MFLVFNKEKIASYIILFSTVVILFGLAFSLTSHDTVATSSNILEEDMNNAISYIIENSFKETNINTVEEMLHTTSANIIKNMQINILLDE